MSSTDMVTPFQALATLKNLRLLRVFASLSCNTGRLQHLKLNSLSYNSIIKINMNELTMQIDTTAEFTQALEEVSKEPSKAEKSRSRKRPFTYRERDADRDQDSGAEDLVPESKRNKTDGMNLNNALK